MDDLRYAVEIAEAGGRLWFVGREEVGCEVIHCVEEVYEMLSDTVVGVVRARVGA